MPSASTAGSTVAPTLSGRVQLTDGMGKPAERQVLDGAPVAPTSLMQQARTFALGSPSPHGEQAKTVIQQSLDGIPKPLQDFYMSLVDRGLSRGDTPSTIDGQLAIPANGVVAFSEFRFASPRTSGIPDFHIQFEDRQDKVSFQLQPADTAHIAFQSYARSPGAAFVMSVSDFFGGLSLIEDAGGMGARLREAVNTANQKTGAKEYWFFAEFDARGNLLGVKLPYAP